MSIEINELRRLAQDQEWIGRWYDAGCETLMAERNGEHEEVAHPYPIGLVPYLVAVQPTAISELLDRLEAAEKDVAMKEQVIDVLVAAAKAEIDALRAAVPDLLEALKTLVEHFEYYMGDNECRPLENARAAIAKATGEQP